MQRTKENEMSEIGRGYLVRTSTATTVTETLFYVSDNGHIYQSAPIDITKRSNPSFSGKWWKGYTEINQLPADAEFCGRYIRPSQF
jgi:hypothetical protein